ncbi:M14 family zinc carboxypeptidase [Deinococcus sp. 23YEL01]|uniref:M14 family zinc carboxypeptidase n=1 Tax=Deinococcus sp. 23YEL01 TaxID=2745871 RepID=UPI001E476EDF|nr:M14 family zinc carboxypeptidase [Deinococcus sp. 23YEL01]MCD0168261.1 pre-peptidase C-terminal domain-containing protein [Deinococcus sp. 23YEL01]
MRRFTNGPALSLILSASLLLGACSQTPQPVAATPTGGTGTLIASADECRTFEQNPVVVSRIDFRTQRDWLDIVKTFEPVGGSLEEGFVLLDVGKADFERLRVTGLTRGWTVQIDARETQRHSASLKNPLGALSINGYSCYRTVEETYTSAQNLAAQYPNLASWSSFGSSWLKTKGRGGYDMNVLKLTNRSVTGTKPRLLITASIHAREYTPAELATRFAEYLLANYGRDADVTWMLDTQEVWLVLQSNPDGRKKAEAGASWRKNANDTQACANGLFGADLNRNFNYAWGTGGSSTDPCNETYRGVGAASEPETQNLQTLIRDAFPDSRGPARTDAAPASTPGVYIDIHSYSKLVLWPWGDTSTVAPNGAALQSLGRKLAFFNGYTPEQSIGLYPTSGTTNDFAYGELGVASYTFELGNAFFESCSAFTGTILPQNQAALLYALRVARAPYQLGSGPDSVSVSAPASVATGGTFTLSASATNTRFNTSNGAEPTRTVTAAEYFIDTPPWAGGTPTAMTATDGSFGSATEAVRATVSTAGLSDGRHTVYVRARNNNGTYGPVSAVFVTVGGTVTPPASTTYTGTVASRGNSYQPSTTGFSYAGGTLKGNLSGPSGTDFDLYLQKLSGSTWTQVAASEGSTSTEAINYTAASGTYRWRVYAYSGSGSYTLTETR